MASINTFALLPSEEKKDVLKEASDTLGILPLFLEKDYWVCFVLDILFSHEAMRPFLYFRGGTSLSKVYDVIQRFSEDIDIELRPEYFLGSELKHLPRRGDSRACIQRKEKRIRPFYRKIIRDDLIPYLQRRLKDYGVHDVEVKTEDLDKARDPYVVMIHYPAVTTAGADGYVKPVVKLEISGRADVEPWCKGVIHPYVGDVIEDFHTPIKVRAVSPKRTFWEKAFILHENNLRSQGDGNFSIPSRLSRHYYDLDSLIQRNYYDEHLFLCIRDLRALKYAYGWVDYENLTPQSMLIMPISELRRQEWRQDYEKMSAILRHDAEPLERILERINLFWKQL